MPSIGGSPSRFAPARGWHDDHRERRNATASRMAFHGHSLPSTRSRPVADTFRAMRTSEGAAPLAGDRRGAAAAMRSHLAPSRACRRPTASSGTSRTPARGRRTAAASPPAAAPTRSTASAISSCRSAAPTTRCSAATSICKGFGLHHDGAGRFDSITPVLDRGHPRVARGVRRRKTRSTCATSTPSPTPRAKTRTVQVAWGGAAGAYEDGGQAAVAATVERRSADRPVGQLRHRDAERQEGARIRRKVRPVMARRRTCSVQGRRADVGRRHVRRSVRSTRGPDSIPRTSATCSRCGCAPAKRVR